jgi:hypothetical protein
MLRRIQAAKGRAGFEAPKCDRFLTIRAAPNKVRVLFR